MSLITPILIVIVAWWIGTGIVLYLQQRISRIRTPLVVALAVVAMVSLGVMVLASNGQSSWHSYAGFVAAIGLWGSIELSYYTGLISGVHKRPCPTHCDTARRFRLALGASIWHEVSVLFAGGVVLTLLYNADNPAGLYTFLVLWLMRWSAKLNLFFGVPNFNTDWFPKRLAYAHSYIRRSPVSLFFPISVVLATGVAVYLVSTALTQPYPQALMIILPGMLLILAILEHLFMALPIADSALWNRIFAREQTTVDIAEALSDNGQSKHSSAQRIHARTQKKINQAITISTKRGVSVTLNPDVTATPSVSQ